jgi:hypothetical protein
LKDDIEAVIDKESETKDLKDLSEVPAVDSIVYQTVWINTKIRQLYMP